MINKQIIKLILASVAVCLIIIFGIIFINKGTVNIISNPKARVYFIKGLEYDTPVTVRLAPGKQSIWIAKDGYELYERQITVKAFGKTNINATLIKISSDLKEGAPTGELLTQEIQQLPYTTAHFTVSWDSDQTKYMIAPIIDIGNSETLTPQEQMANQWGLYTQYGQEGLVWVKSQGVTPTKNNVEWWGQEYWPEGKSMIIQ